MAGQRWKPLSLTPLLRLRWRKSAVLACRPRIAALAQAPCSRETVRGLQRLTAQTFYSFRLSSLRSTAIFVFSFYIIPLSTFFIPNSNKSRRLLISAEKFSRTKSTQPASAWRGGGRSASAVNPIRRCANWYSFATVRFLGYEMRNLRNSAT